MAKYKVMITFDVNADYEGGGLCVEAHKRIDEWPLVKDKLDSLEVSVTPAQAPVEELAVKIVNDIINSLDPDSQEDLDEHYKDLVTSVENHLYRADMYNRMGKPPEKDKEDI